jgi:DNA-binding IclR family transcriptional regulator
MAGTGGNGRGRSVISKVVALLEAFTVADPELSLNELALRAGLPLSTAYRLATELVEWGGLERAEGGGYRVGLRLWEIGSLASRSAGIREVALPFMQDLYETTHENVHLAVRDGHEALYVEKITGRRSVAIKTRRGGRLPLHATGVGKVLLAFGPAELLDEVLAAGLRRYSPHTVVAPGHLRRSLADIRRTGVGFAHEEITPGAVSVAAPILASTGDAVAAISIVSHSTGANLRRLAPAVRMASACISRGLRDPSRGTLTSQGSEL